MFQYRKIDHFLSYLKETTPPLSPKLVQQCLAQFPKIEESFNRHKGNRKNFLPYSSIVAKIALKLAKQEQKKITFQKVILFARFFSCPKLLIAIILSKSIDFNELKFASTPSTWKELIHEELWQKMEKDV
jgi:hypothetical protein